MNDSPNPQSPASESIVPATVLPTNVHNTALIFEGGGMRAAYTSAVCAMLINEGVWFDWVGGISAGSSLSASYLARDAKRAKESFVDFAADPNFGSWRTWLEGKGRFSAEYIYEQTAEPHQAFPYDWATYQANQTDFGIGAFEMRTGKMHYWSRSDVSVMRDLLVRVRASSSLPILMPPVTIGDNVFVDGALGPTGGFALDAAKRAGYERFLVVMTRSRDYYKPPARVSTLIRQVFRKHPAVINGILQRPARYNHTRAELFDLEKEGRAYLFCPENLTISNSETNVAKLEHQYRLGEIQTAREQAAMLDFIHAGE
ncbi:patatin-like phospholipase family protein [Gulosibacter bifidus]|uniref:Patatin family protein n=1 Tax=Gulosibacter bifidus TaxID=272239 RepID=A0ABW5RHN9_9MICO|nr:patatin family protein [Gulosibacter bifidus]